MNIGRRQAGSILCVILFFALSLRLVISFAYPQTFDLYWYKDWALELQNGLFTVYGRADQVQLDYPPLYLFPLYLVGQLYRLLPAMSTFLPLEMLVLKLFPVLGDCLCCLVLYRICRRYSEAAGLLAAALWAVNPSMIFNSSFWGQTDGIMALLLLLSFDCINMGRLVRGTVVFAVACLTKFQSLFFAPVVVLHLVFRLGWKKLLQALGAAVGVTAAVFLPFMIGSGDWLLPFRVYFFGAGSYPYSTLYGANLYGALGQNWKPDFQGPVPMIAVGLVLMLGALASLVVFYYKRKQVSPWVAGLFFMQCIFICMTRMHERYQIIVLAFALLAWMATKRNAFLYLFGALTGITLVNQALLLLRYNLMSGEGLAGGAPVYTAGMEAFGDTAFFLLCLVNIAVFIWSAVICVGEIMKREEGENEDEDKAKEPAKA